MVTDTLYYGGVIPADFIATWYDDIVVWADENLDNQLARMVTYLNTELDETTEDYELTKIDFAGDDVIPKSKSSPGVEVSIGGAGETAKIWRWADYFTMNEADIKKSPTLQSKYVSGCMTKIFRGEDKVYYNGRSANDITGMQTTARANSNGKITAAASSGNNVGNTGAWQTVDSNRDIYEDLRVARGMLDARFRANKKNLYLVGHSDDIDCLYQKDPYNTASRPIHESVCGLFGRTVNEDPATWAISNDQITEGYVYIVCKNREAAELIQAKSITIDDNYPRSPIGNLQVHLYQDTGIAFHNDNAFVEIQVT